MDLCVFDTFKHEGHVGDLGQNSINEDDNIMLRQHQRIINNKHQLNEK